MNICEATVSDIRALMRLYLEHLTAHPPEEPQDERDWAELFAELIKDPDYHIFVGEAEGIVVSSVTLVVIKNLTHNLRPYALIENVVTHSDFRGRGYASALIDYANICAGERGCYKIMLLTGSKKPETLRFYERCGFNKNDKTGFIKRL